MLAHIKAELMGYIMKKARGDGIIWNLLLKWIWFEFEGLKKTHTW